MRIIAKRTLVQFIAGLSGHHDEQAVTTAIWSWYGIVKEASWPNAMALKQHIGHASIVGDRVVFNIKGNDYRLIVAMDYEHQIAYIKWLGTHRDYDKVDVRTAEHGY